MAKAPGGASAQTAAASAKKGVSAGAIGLAVIVVLVLSLAMATPALLRRHRGAAAATEARVSPPATPSDGDAVDDRREHSG